ncbi:hypothetical protein KKF84_09000, partial [Myxococcota bacterium]|nr:hypothetical protein [Myxococcota bacterium]
MRVHYFVLSSIAALSLAGCQAAGVPFLSPLIVGALALYSLFLMSCDPPSANNQNNANNVNNINNVNNVNNTNNVNNVNNVNNTNNLTGDADGDGILDGDDNCPLTPNPDQLDSDGDG